MEQETILAIVRVVASFSDNLSSSSPSPPSTSSPPLPANARDAVRSGSTGGLSPSAFTPPPATGDGGGSGGSGEVSMPMLPRGVSVSIVVDLAAMSIALTAGGVNVAAVALSAAHCKVNVSTTCLRVAVDCIGCVEPLRVSCACAGDAMVEDIPHLDACVAVEELSRLVVLEACRTLVFWQRKHHLAVFPPPDG